MATGNVHRPSRRSLLKAGLASALLERAALADPTPGVAQVAITLDLEMARHYPTWDRMNWDYEKGNLDSDTKRYALEAGRRVARRGGKIHYFAVGQVFEQEKVDWLAELASLGHPIGNHTYDHVNLLATDRSQIQFRFQRAPWLIAGRTPAQVIEDNVRLCTMAMRERLGRGPVGFRTPGGFADGLRGRADLQAMLLRQGFSWVSSLYPAHKNVTPGKPVENEVMDDIVRAQAFAQPFRYPSGLVEIPMSPISDVNAFRTGRWPLDAFLEAIRRAIVWTIDRGAVFDFLAHPSCLVVTDPKFQTIDLIQETVQRSNGRAELVDLDTIAQSFARAHAGKGSK